MNTPPTNPNLMTAEERLSEAAKIIATAILKYQQKQRKTEKFPVDKSPTVCLHGEKPSNRRKP
jgi:hypothetical protein